ncbi:hypothetical protein BTA51_02685 [Hahella sp. CCB-MM4]|uniref:DUF5666 domain-containing protein n=1 Tax=Hahella sp. (strain CCB-MM4) TaxID=1926491 RepID=UPI000B9A49AC|nr:DUF5666 domain-containing protein [Hahella sp. CCB-MM4]OZG75310.1 hypothetical protein BTA51_02685 [Hahella sp. CCB-MM4]
MMIFRQLILFACVLGIVLSSGCGGGSGGGSVASNGGIEGTGAPVASMGSVTAFGSVFVNGVEYDTNSANITIDNTSSQPEDSLSLGMVVLVKGTVNRNGKTGDANSVVFDQNLEGPISSTNTVDGLLVLTALGIEVTVTDDTVLENVDYDGLTAGIVISVSGFTAGDSIIATRIEKLADSHTNGDKLEVEGIVGNIDTLLKEFTIGTQNVDYDGAVVVPASATLENGSLVEVKGTEFNGATLVATQVRIKSKDAGFENGDNVEIEGVITDFNSSADFTVSGVIVNASDADFSNGSESDLANGIRLEIEGEIDTDGVLQASKVTIKSNPKNKLRAEASNINTTAHTLTLLGVTVETNSTTIFQDTGTGRLRFFTFEDIEEGDWIDVQGNFQGGTVSVSRLTRRQSSSGVLVKGTVTAKTADTLTVMGITIDTTDVDASSIVVGDLIVAEGLTVIGADTLRADSISVED